MSDSEGHFDGAELSDTLKARLKISIPGFQLINIVGYGGQATVYKGIDEATGVAVAVKILHGGPFANDVARQRFKRETIALKALKHPNIVSLVASGETPNGHDYLIMEYIDGQTLETLWKPPRSETPERLDPPARLRLFVKICKAIGAAHRSGITHRDLCPTNIRVDALGEPHILDFGLARSAFDVFLQTNPHTISTAGQFLGKIGYASPEQVKGLPAEIDIRTDVYALGVILYQIITGGSFPYEVRGSLADVLNNIVNFKPAPPSLLLHRAQSAKDESPPQVTKLRSLLLNERIDAIVMKALEKNPDLRYQSASEFAQAIEQFLVAAPVTVQARGTQRSNTRSRWITTFALTCLAVAVATASVYVIRGNPYLPMRSSERRARVTSAATQSAESVQSLSDPSSPLDAPRVDLLKLLDMNLDVRPGADWTMKDGVLTTIGEGSHNIEFPYVPPAEYDYRAVFECGKADVDSLMFFCVKNNTQFEWRVAGYKNTICYLEANSGWDSFNRTAKRRGHWITQGQRNAVVIKIRKNGIDAYLNDVRLLNYPTDYHEFGIKPDWLRFERTDTIGFIFLTEDVKVYSAEVVEISGSGRSVR